MMPTRWHARNAKSYQEDKKVSGCQGLAGEDEEQSAEGFRAVKILYMILR